MIRKSPKRGRRLARSPTTPVRRRDYALWRAATLACVYLLFAIHVVHWKIAGRTLAPLELNEVMYTLELGIITAGFIFMAVAVLATLLFGRFFCSWGCHILALEDLAAWLLGKLRIHPRPIRSRVLKWVPLGAMLYMFAWPQVTRLLQSRDMPALHLRTDADGWASFLTSDFSRNLPGPGIALLTFFICGFVMIYVLGSRAFCTYACPYGAIFRIADRFAPGRIVARGDCSRCGKCTAACQSHVLVHRELTAFGRVTDPACLKDLDCVAACPEGNVAYGIARPAILTIGAAERVTRPRYDFSWTEDAAMAVVFLASLFIFRGLYGEVPFLLTLAIGGILAYLLILATRLASRCSLRLSQLTLKAGGRITMTGWTFAVACMAIFAFTAHSAFIRYHEHRGRRCFEATTALTTSTDAVAREAAVADGIRHLEFCERWGLFHPDGQRRNLAVLHARKGEQLAERGDLRSAADHLSQSTRLYPLDAPTHYNYGVILAALGRRAEAIREYRLAIRLDPSDADVHNNLGLMLAESGDLSAAAGHLSHAVRLKPEFAAPHFNLGRVYQAMGRLPEARSALQAAARLDADYAPYVAELIGNRAAE